MQAIADRTAAYTAAWSIRAGRLLRFGPDWPEAEDRLVFDACSGDYWVLDDLGHAVVRQLLDGGVLTAEQLLPAVVLPGASDRVNTVLEGLLEAGLIQTAPGSPS